MPKNRPGDVFIDRERGHALAQERIKTFNIKGMPVSAVESLSGGNQQRTLLSLLRDPLVGAGRASHARA